MSNIKTIQTTTLVALVQALQVPPSYNATPALTASDVATMAQLILDDGIPDPTLTPAQQLTQVIYPGALANGFLNVPRRGPQKILPGDWICVDAAGWPFILGRASVPQTGTVSVANTATGSTRVTNLPTNVLNLGWAAGMPCTATSLSTGTVISQIDANGLALTLNQVPAQTTSTAQLTAGAWTHS